MLWQRCGLLGRHRRSRRLFAGDRIAGGFDRDPWWTRESTHILRNHHVQAAHLASAQALEVEISHGVGYQGSSKGMPQSTHVKAANLYPSPLGIGQILCLKSWDDAL